MVAIFDLVDIAEVAELKENLWLEDWAWRDTWQGRVDHLSYWCFLFDILISFFFLFFIDLYD